MLTLPELLSELSRLEKLATSGEWKWDSDTHDGRVFLFDAYGARLSGEIAHLEDAELLVLLRNSLPRLIEAAKLANHTENCATRDLRWFADMAKYPCGCGYDALMKGGS